MPTTMNICDNVSDIPFGEMFEASFDYCGDEIGWGTTFSLQSLYGGSGNNPILILDLSSPCGESAFTTGLMDELHDLYDYEPDIQIVTELLSAPAYGDCYWWQDQIYWPQLIFSSTGIYYDTIWDAGYPAMAVFDQFGYLIWKGTHTSCGDWCWQLNQEALNTIDVALNNNDSSTHCTCPAIFGSMGCDGICSQDPPEYDECGVCGGDGEIFCGCYDDQAGTRARYACPAVNLDDMLANISYCPVDADYGIITEAECDLISGSVWHQDPTNPTVGNCGDGWCDDKDDCFYIGAGWQGGSSDPSDCYENECYDECGVCNGPGAIYECGCEPLVWGFCDCARTIIAGPSTPLNPTGCQPFEFDPAYPIIRYSVPTKHAFVCCDEWTTSQNVYDIVADDMTFAEVCESVNMICWNDSGHPSTVGASTLTLGFPDDYDPVVEWSDQLPFSICGYPDCPGEDFDPFGDDWGSWHCPNLERPHALPYIEQPGDEGASYTYPFGRATVHGAGLHGALFWGHGQEQCHGYCQNTGGADVVDGYYTTPGSCVGGTNDGQSCTCAGSCFTDGVDDCPSNCSVGTGQHSSAGYDLMDCNMTVGEAKALISNLEWWGYIHDGNIDNYPDLVNTIGPGYIYDYCGTAVNSFNHQNFVKSNWMWARCKDNPNNPFYGCTDPLACNYDPSAIVDSGFCEYQAMCWDGTFVCDPADCEDPPSPFSGETMSYTLHVGNNLIGIPLTNIEGGNGISDLFGIYDRARHFRPFRALVGEGDAAFINEDGYWLGSLMNIDPKSGYWFVLDTPLEVFIHGELVDNPTYELHEGPNLISFPGLYPTPITTALPDNTSGIIYGILGEGAGSFWGGVNPDIFDEGIWYGSLTEFQPGRGYWLKSSQNISFQFNLAETYTTSATQTFEYRDFDFPKMNDNLMYQNPSSGIYEWDIDDVYEYLIKQMISGVELPPAKLPVRSKSNLRRRGPNYRRGGKTGKSKLIDNILKKQHSSKRKK